MSNFSEIDRPGADVLGATGAARVESPEQTRATLFNRRLREADDIDAQKAWQADGSVSERQARAFFDILATGAKGAARPPALGMPDTDALTAELLSAAADKNYEPTTEWCEIIHDLRHFAADSGEVDVLELLTSPAFTASQRWQWWQKEISGLFKYTWEKDYARLRAETEPVEPASPDPSLKGGEDEGVEERENGEPDLPPAQEDEMRTSMDELEKGKESESTAWFSVHPFWGGYYRQNVYEIYQGGTKWGKADRKFSEAATVELLPETHILRGQIRALGVTPLPLPYGFCPDISSLRVGEDVKILVDQNGYFYLDARAASKNCVFTIVVGRPKNGWENRAQEPAQVAVKNPLVSAQSREIINGLSGDVLQKARILKKYVRDSLEYSNDSSLNLVYENFGGGYFAAIENFKKADCDVANAYYVNLLSAAGVKARLVAGHYVKNSGRNGAAVMGSGSRHAWTEVWDEVGKSWHRFDATPDGDPTLDEERPDEADENEECEQPGDYGEQEAQQLTEEELEEWRKKIAEAKKAAEKVKNLTPKQIEEQTKNKEFADKVGCSEKEAASTRARLEAARNLCDKRGRVIRTFLSGEFQKIVDSNLKETEVWKGPVTKSEGDEPDNIAMIGKEVAAGSANPLGYSTEAPELVLAQEYGGIDVYVVVDRSASIAEIDPITQMPKKDEQQTAAFLILDSMYGFSYKTERAAKQNQLISPLSVRSGVVAFQAGDVSTLKETGSTWTEKDQYDVWKGMESNIGGGTPAHLGLARVRQEIENELLAVAQLPPTERVKYKKRLKIVLVFMDGGVDNKIVFLAEQKRLEDLGVDVSSWGMTQSAAVVDRYPNGHCLPTAREMIEPVCEHIIDKAQALKLKRNSAIRG